jgi:hypothetical protein
MSLLVEPVFEPCRHLAGGLGLGQIGKVRPVEIKGCKGTDVIIA